MKISSLLMGHVGEVSFVYHHGLEGYMTLMSYINELYEIIDEILIGDRALGTTIQIDILDYMPLCSYRKKLYS